MRMLAMKCESCGAPLDLPAKTAEAHCLYCNNAIWIEHSTPRQSSPPSPPKETATNPIQDEIAQLDREWEAYRAKYLKRDEKTGQYDIPEEEHCRMGMWATGVIGIGIILLVSITESPFGAVPFSIVIAVFMACAFVGLRRQMTIARVYARSKRNYEEERMRLVKKLKSA